MKKLISILVMVAFVVTTTMPSASHAVMDKDGAAVQTQQAAKGHDCHGHDEAKVASDKTAQNDKDALDKCCDKGMCKCIGGTCHNGLSQILGNGGTPLFALTANKNQFGFVNEFVDSALPNRLKRPPKA